MAINIDDLSRAVGLLHWPCKLLNGLVGNHEGERVLALAHGKLPLKCAVHGLRVAGIVVLAAPFLVRAVELLQLDDIVSANASKRLSWKECCFPVRLEVIEGELHRVHGGKMHFAVLEHDLATV